MSMPATQPVQRTGLERFPPTPVGDGCAVDVAFLCADVVDFTRMTERLGDLGALSVMRELARCVRGLAQRFEGSVLEIQGDAFLLAFDAPQAAVDCALALSLAVRDAIHAPHLEDAEHVCLRMVVHSGEAIRDGDGYFGRSVILPYRILPQLDPGRIAVTSAAALRVLPAQLRGARRFDGFEPKGMREPVDYRVLDANPSKRSRRSGRVAKLAAVH